MGFLDAASKLIRQAGAGTVEYFGAGSKDPGDPRNASQIPIAEPTITGMYKLGQVISDVLPIPYRLYNSTLEDSAAKLAKNSQSINKKFGVDEPANAGEVVARMLPSLVGPGAEVKGLEHVAGKYLSNAVKTVARAGADTILPFSQGGLKTAAVASGIGVGLNEVADTIDNKDTYTSFHDLTSKGVVQPHLQQKPFGDYLSPESAQIYNNAITEGDVQTQDDIRTQVMQLQNSDKQASYLPPTPWWQTDAAKEAAVVGAAGVAAVFGNRALQATKLKLFGGTSVLAGQDVTPHLSGVMDKATQGAVQNDHMIRDATARATGDKGRITGSSQPLKQWLAKLDTVTNPAIHSKQEHFAMTGELPNSQVTVQPLGPMLDGIETKLEPAEKSLLTDGLLAGSALDDYKRFGVQTSFTHDAQGNPVSQADVQHIYDLVKNDPKLAPIADAVRGHYRSQLDYMEEAGVISAKQKQDFITNGPNFVHMSKNTAPDSVRSLWSRGDNSSVVADRRINMLGSRSDEEGGGVQAGATADPIAELPNQWSKLIREIEIGKVKKQWLDFASQSPELKEWVKPLPVGADAKAGTGIHTVFNNGMEQHYHVKDPALSEALNFQPFAQSNAVSGTLNLFRRNFENFTTGAGNPFFAPVAASYDTFTGMALKPKGYDLGVLNEILAHINPKLSIGNLDPTWLVSAPIGAARHGWDSLVGAMGNGLATELQAGKGMVLDTLGPQITQNLATKLSNMYVASIKSQMDEAGVANANIFTSARPDRVAPGLSTIAPKFATGVAARAFGDALKGDHSLAQQILAGSHYAFESTRAAPIARLYSGVLKSIHEGFRYQAYATNLPKVVDPASAELLASQTRRVAADIGQKGAGELAQTGLNGFAYANAGIQSLAQMARMFRDQPVTFTLNTMTSLLGLASLYYGPALISKDHRDEMRKRTEEQRMGAFQTFGGLEVKVPPELRPIWGSITAILDDASGLNSVNPDGSDNFNSNFASAIQSWLDNGLSEPGQMDFKQNIKEGLWGASPVTTGSSPVVNAAMALQGLDVAYTRYTGTPQGVKSQQIDPLAGEGEYTDDAISANWQKAIEDVSGVMLSGYIRAGLDVQRATKDGASDLDHATKVATSRIVDIAARQTGPASRMFGDYERKESANDGEMQLYQKKKAGFEQAVSILNKDILTPYTDGRDPRSASLSQLDPLDLQNNIKLQGTALVPIGASAAEITKAVRPLDQQITNIKKEIDGITNQKTSTIEERNKQINELIEKRKVLIKQQNNFYRVGEDAIRKQIGDPTFTFQGFADHFDRYSKLPWPPSPQPVQPASVQ